MDVLDDIYNALVADDFIREQAMGRIKFFEYPATGDVTGPYIVIDEISPPIAIEYGSNKEIAYEQITQIDVWSTDRKLTRNLANAIRDTLRNKNVTQSAIGPSDYDKGVFRDARRYTHIFYKE
ncbi:hypothetical protein [Lentibacillus saliphilus]|uniref:hypothetical protein n=1 Tax=Lentibacillus saliphilus TaxID=2737028 RepID=UPI001C2F639E|nr:hypothetical protein [Lentibacillus saliphilus]